MKAKEYDETLQPDCSKNLYASAYYGLWRRRIFSNGEEREFLVYTPDSYFPNQRVVYLILPAGVGGETFLEESVWAAISEETGTVLVLAEAKGQGRWKTAPEEEAYLEAVVTTSAFSPQAESMAVNSDGHYLAAYDEGADAALPYLLKHPTQFSAAAISGAKQTDEKYLDTIGDTALSAPGIPKEESTFFCNRDCRLPVWIIGGEDRDNALVSYLKNVNHVSEAPEWNGFASVYREIPTPYFDTMNRKPVSSVCVTARKDAEKSYRDEALTRAIWQHFFAGVIRYGEGPVGALRKYISCEDAGIQVFHEKMYHASFDREVDRMYAVYVPTSCHGDGVYPLVVATHGYTGTYDYFARNSELWRVAEEQGFLVAFTQAVPDSGSRCGTPRWRSGWKNRKSMFPETDNEDAFVSEIAYFRRIVERVCSRYPIDRSRIYCTGHSNGSEMTYGISREMKDVFAATAMVGFSVQEYEKDADMPNEDLRMPYLNIEHSGDFFTNPDDPGSPLYHELRWRKKENGIPADARFYAESDNGKYKVREYRNGQGIPLVNYIYYRNACHSYLPETGYIVWDRFLCDFTRGEDGTSYYRGKPCE